jgi:hypothetical protein
MSRLVRCLCGRLGTFKSVVLRASRDRQRDESGGLVSWQDTKRVALVWCTILLYSLFDQPAKADSRTSASNGPPPIARN